MLVSLIREPTKLQTPRPAYNCGMLLSLLLSSTAFKEQHKRFKPYTAQDHQPWEEEDRKGRGTWGAEITQGTPDTTFSRKAK